MSLFNQLQQYRNLQLLAQQLGLILSLTSSLEGCQPIDLYILCHQDIIQTELELIKLFRKNRVIVGNGSNGLIILKSLQEVEIFLLGMAFAGKKIIKNYNLVNL